MKTIEEKAKAYDEAIARAKVWKEKSGMPADRQGILDDIFPELKESEDEEIRKSIIGFLKTIASLKNGKTVSNEDFDSKELLNWAAWLEKQGDKDKLIKELGEYQVKYTQEVLEKQINSMSNKDDERLRKTTISFLKKFADKGYENAVECIDWLEAQWEQNITNSCCKTFNDEQKSADKVEPKFKVGDIIYKPSNSSCPVHSSIDGTLCTVIEVLDKHYILDTNEGRIQESFAWQDYYELVNQKPAWSEEDEMFVHGLIRGLAAKRDIHKHTTFSSDCIDITKTINWLEFLKYRVKPQTACGGKDDGDLHTIANNFMPEPSWNVIIETKEEGSGAFAYDYNQMVNMFKAGVEWLKSLRPQSQWKPTERMLEALKWAKCEFHQDCPETMEQLKYLYQELKQLYYDRT